MRMALVALSQMSSDDAENATGLRKMGPSGNCPAAVWPIVSTFAPREGG
jgi:hypothetical protein